MKGAVVQDEGGSKRDMQTHRCAHIDSHMHTQGHPGGFKDRSCWTHPHGDKGRGWQPLHRGAQRGETHPQETKSRETNPCTYPCTGSHGDAVTHSKEESLSPTQKKSLSHACMNTEQLHTAVHYKRPCHSQAHTCLHEPSHTGIISLPYQSLSLSQTQMHLHINTRIHNLATSIFLDSYCGSLRFCIPQNPCSHNGVRHAFTITFSASFACHPPRPPPDGELLETWENLWNCSGSHPEPSIGSAL